MARTVIQIAADPNCLGWSRDISDDASNDQANTFPLKLAAMMSNAIGMVPKPRSVS